MARPAVACDVQPTEAVVCNLCGQDDAAVVTEQDRYGLPTRIVQCRQCGLQYQNPRMSAAQYAAFYRGTYRALLEAHLGRSYRPEELENDQWRYATDISITVAPWVAPLAGGTLLDVGGSTGVVGRLFRARWGFDVTVIDPAPKELARAQGCRTICGSAETVDLPVADVALLCRTIDHLLDPKAVLTRLRQRARVLVVDAMNTTTWPSSARYKVDHPYAFTVSTLTRMVGEAGWRPLQVWQRCTGKYVGLVCSPQE